MNVAPKSNPPVKRFFKISSAPAFTDPPEMQPARKAQTTTVPTIPKGALQSITFVTKRKINEIKIKRIEVSPIQPALVPIKY